MGTELTALAWRSADLIARIELLRANADATFLAATTHH
jgi:hypothetical protein